MGFDYVIQHKLRASNRVANALSRKDPPMVELQVLVSHEGVDWARIQAELQNDPYIKN